MNLDWWKSKGMNISQHEANKKKHSGLGFLFGLVSSSTQEINRHHQGLLPILWASESQPKPLFATIAS